MLAYHKNLLNDMNALLLLLLICEEFGVFIMMAVVAPGPVSPLREC